MSNQNFSREHLFPGLYAPPPGPSPNYDTSLNTIVRRIMTADNLHPEGDHITLTITWAIGIAGCERFLQDIDSRYGRRGLNPNDELAETKGKPYGLSDKIADWLMNTNRGRELTLSVIELWPRHS